MFDVKIYFGSLNVGGLKELVKRKAVFLFCKGQRFHCLFLQETHSTEAEAPFWSNQWGERILFSHGSSRSGGVAICFNNFPGEVITHRSDIEGHWLAVVVKINDLFLILVNVYGYNNDTLNKVLLNTLTNVISELKSHYPTNNILCGGDWNLTPNEWLDRWPARVGRPQYNTTINNFMVDNNLRDIWREMNPGINAFSWFRPNGSCKSRIDFWLGSDNVMAHITKASMSKAPLSDHCLIDLNLEPTIKMTYHKGYWKINDKLLQNEEYCNMIKKVIAEIDNSSTIIGSINK